MWNGKLGQVTQVLENNWYKVKFQGHTYSSRIKILQNDKSIKHSKNIIDLIEEGDIINRYLIVYKGKVANGTEKLLAGNHIVRGMALEVVDIKTVVTKEQFKSVEYKITK